MERAEITLHVGYGTFQPVRVEQVEDHRVDPERFEIDREAAAAITARCRRRAPGRRGRHDDDAGARVGGSIGRRPCAAGAAATAAFIYPGFQFQVLGGLLTNFHLPQSSLLMLVCAFAGRDAVLAAYREAVARGYRFYSYGDAMLII